MQTLIVFIIIYPSLGMCVFAWKNLNELFCLLFSHHVDCVVFTSVCETGESWDSVVFTAYLTHLLSSIPSSSPVHRWTHELPTYPLPGAGVCKGCSPSLLRGAGLCLPEAEERS